MKKIKLITLCCIGALSLASESFGQANPFINVLPSNSGKVIVGATIDIVVTIGNTGPASTIAQAKLRPVIQIPASVTFLSNGLQTGLPAGWTILTNTGSQLRLCNSTDPIGVNTSRTITLKAQGVTVSAPQSLSANINFGNGSTCLAGSSVLGDLTTDNSATSTIKVDPRVTLNLNVFLEGYFDGTSAMAEAMLNQNYLPTPAAGDVDDITVELRQYNTTTTEYDVVPSGSAVARLKTNGTASAVFPPELASGSYYIVINHRNHVQVYSQNAVAIASGTNSYSFTSAASQAAGSNMVLLANGQYGMYSGDVNQDGYVDSFDYGVFDTDAQNNITGTYVATDLNGDGYVDSFDYGLMDTNTQNNVTVSIP